MKTLKAFDEYYFQTHFDESFCWLENMPIEDDNRSRNFNQRGRPKKNAFSNLFRNRFGGSDEMLVKSMSD